MNRLMTGGMDVLWRKEVIRLADLAAGSKLLDLEPAQAIWQEPPCNTPLPARSQLPTSHWR